MIGIKSIASYVPAEGLDNYAQGAKFGKEQDFIFGKIGSTFLPRKDVTQETSDLCVEAAKNLFAANATLDPASIDAVIVVTQNGDAEGLPHTAAIVQHKLGLTTAVAAFDISLGCSGYVYGLYAMKGFMEAAGLKNGLLITADPYSKIVDPEDRNTTMLFGDAATATWMGEGATWQLGKSLFGSDGAGAEHLRTTDGKFFMNGRQVYNFALVKVPAHLQQLLDASELKSDDIDLYCLHQGSAAIVDAVTRLGRDLGLPVTAEGIETDASFDWLSDQGCQFGQGYLFGHAMPKSEMDEILATAQSALPLRPLAQAS